MQPGQSMGSRQVCLRESGADLCVHSIYFYYDRGSHFNAVHVMLMKKLSDSPADVMENLSFGLSVDHVLAVTVSGLLGAVWKFVGPEWVFVLGAAVCLVHFGVAVWLGKRAN